MRIERSRKNLLRYRDGGVPARYPWNSLEEFIFNPFFWAITLTTSVHDDILSVKGDSASVIKAHLGE